MKLYLLIAAIAIFFFASCKPTEVLTHNDVRTEYIQKLIPVILPAETANARALLECSAEGRVLLSQLNIETSRNAQLSFLLDSIGNLSVETIVERDTFYIKADSIIITKDVLRTEVEYRDKELSRWQKAKQEAGGIAIGVSVAAILALIIFVVVKVKRLF